MPARQARSSGSGVRATGRGRRAVVILISAGASLLLTGCRTSGEPSPGPTRHSGHEPYSGPFGNFELPRKLGSVENVNLQIPTISPDGNQMLYLRTDRDFISPMTLLGSADPRHTLPEGTLAIWIRPVSGTAPGRRLSGDRWAHSPVWSDSGRAIAYVVNEPPASFIVHHDPATAEEHILGVPDAVNCLPRFDGDDKVLLFCSGSRAHGPFRIYRQTVGDPEPVALTPEGVDCVFPIASDADQNVLCARVEGDHLNWARCGPDGTTDLESRCGVSQRPALLQTWAGITSPLSPDRKSFLFYDMLQNRIRIFHVAEKRIAGQRTESIAACWLTHEAIALATTKWVFLVDTVTQISPVLFNGSWIPCRYVPATGRLLLLGQENARRFSIVEVVSKPR